MRALETIATGIRRFPLRTPTLPPATHTNCYIIGQEEAVIVEPASPYPEEQEALQQALERAEVQVSQIFLTHHHHDHIGGVAALKQKTGATVVAHPLTRDLLAGKVDIDETVDEGQVLQCDVHEIQLLHTPGHAPGHLCGHIEAVDTIIAGDMVAGVGTILLAPSEGDLGQYITSLERLMALGPSVLLPAHGPALVDAVGVLQQYIDHRHMRTAQILSALRALAEPSSAMDIAAQVYPDLPEMYRALGAEQIKTHLKWLIQRGEASALDSSLYEATTDIA